MKRVKLTLMSFTLLALLMTTAYASTKQVGGLIIGGSTGAIVGNAVGKNVESTIIGATFGGVLGYAIGNELDKHHGSVDQYTVVVSNSKRHYKRHRSSYRDHKRHNNSYRSHKRYNNSYRAHKQHNNYKNSQHRDTPRYRHHSNNRNYKKANTDENRHNKTKRVESTIRENGYRDHKSTNNLHKYNERYYR